MKESGLLGEMADSETGQDIHKISLDHPVVPESRSTQKKKKKKSALVGIVQRVTGASRESLQ